MSNLGRCVGRLSPRIFEEAESAMHTLIDTIRSTTPPDFDFEWMGELVRSIRIADLDLTGCIPSIEGMTDNYARNILLLDPFEVVVLHWPPGVESAIHHHEGFWGYVLCVEGEVENVEYTYDAERRELREGTALRVRAGGVLPEPDGTIHKIVNPSPDKSLVTVHFYAPALDNLDGMVLFDAEKRWLGELNETATTASFSQDESGFRRLEKEAFTFIPINEVLGSGTHRLYPLIPKPAKGEILHSISAYYSEQAQTYDHLDQGSEKRHAYTQSINGIIADDIGSRGSERVLHIACGTGRRAMDIRERSGLSYRVEGVDISAGMIETAKGRGVDARIGHWNEVQVEEDAYDSITFLYAFGHIPSEGERRKSLTKAFKALRPGGRLYFDVFNVDNPNEWGPEALHLFEELELANEGYERGDLFYKRHGGQTVAFLHYCSQEGIRSLVESCGFHVHDVHRIGYVDRPGEQLQQEEEGGNLLIFAEKPTI